MRRVLLSMVITVTFLCESALSQDNHYEYLKFGSRNSILANAGLSRFEDQSAVIINPATLSYATSSGFSFNTTAVGLNTIKFSNGLGQSFDIKYGNLNVLPNMAAGVLKPKKNKRDFVLGYGIYDRMNDRLRFTDRQQNNLDLINNAESPGSEVYIAQYNLAHDVQEICTILGIGWDLNDAIAMGVSQAFTFRSEEYAENFTSSAIPFRDQGATVDVISANTSFYTRYSKLMAQTKVGIAAKIAKWDIGVTVGLPSLGILGTGEVMSQASLNNIRLSQDLSVPRKSYFANGRAEKLKARYKYGATGSVGISRPIGKVRIYIAGNWYSGLKAYTVLDPGQVDFIQPANDSNVLVTPNYLRVYAQSTSVINASLGADWTYNGNKHLFMSLHTDNNFAQSNDAEAGRQLAVKRWDNYHFAIGTQQNFRSSEWMIGIRYSFAQNEGARQPYSFEDPTENNLLQGERGTGVLTATSLQLMLSYSFIFGANKDK